MPLRVVADSNVLISAFHSAAGNPAAVVDRARRGEFQLFASVFIFEEVARILRDKMRWDTERLSAALVRLRHVATLVDPGRPRLNVVGDPNDNRIVECAPADRARYLVTGDRLLLDLAAYRRIQIVTPRQFIDLLPEPSPPTP